MHKEGLVSSNSKLEREMNQKRPSGDAIRLGRIVLDTARRSVGLIEEKEYCNISTIFHNRCKLHILTLLDPLVADR